MYICLELDQNDVCTHWANYADVLALPEGLTGLHLGGMFLSLVVAAWCIQQIARLVLNR